MLCWTLPICYADPPRTMDDFHAMLAERAAENAKTKDAHRFSALRKDYFVRFNRDPDARPAGDELAMDSSWRIVVA